MVLRKATFYFSQKFIIYEEIILKFIIKKTYLIVNGQLVHFSIKILMIAQVIHSCLVGGSVP